MLLEALGVLLLGFIGSLLILFSEKKTPKTINGNVYRYQNYIIDETGMLIYTINDHIDIKV